MMLVYHHINVLIFVILCCVSIVKSYNVDTQRVIRYEGNSDSMFGFTVAAHVERGSSMVLVGAPNATTSRSGIRNGGAVYRCDISRNNACAEIPFDPSGDYQSNGKIVDQKSGQWFGSTLYSAGVDGPVVACASRYVWFSTTNDRRDPVGTCYVARNDFSEFSEYSPCRTSQWGYHRQGSCQAGFSAAISNDGNDLFIGAPGNCYWQGRMYSVDATAKFPYKPPLFAPYGEGQVIRQSLQTRPKVVHTIDGSEDDDDSYLGYSVAIGKFSEDGKQGIAAGMPRGGNLVGKVLLYTWNLTNFMNITGRQMGSYFGYAVTALDIDGDKYDDLVIGAPMFAEPNNEGKYEVGKVYVIYQRSETGKFTKLDELDGFRSKSRFGLSLASLGDINLDGYMDFAVGAPYDGPHERGAVYIFHGSKNGVLQKYSQVIYAEEIRTPPPLTFGFSLAGGIDLDRNGYPDTIIGAYLSNTAFFLRSRPVVKVSGYAQFQSINKEIALEDKKCRINVNGDVTPVACTTIDTCLSYTGFGVPREISLQLQYVLDTQKTKYPRMFFVENNRPLPNIWNGTWRLNKDSQHKCDRKTVYIRDDIRDKLTPLEVEVKYSMDPLYSYTELSPVLDLASASLKKDSINVRKNCGNDNICVPDLMLDAKPNVQRYLLASNEVLIFDITISNDGEDSFETTFAVQTSEDVNFNKVQDSGDVKISCRQASTNHTYICDIGNPLPAKKIVNFKMHFKPQYKEGMKSFYVFNMEVNSTNPENKATIGNNKVTVKLPVWVNSRLKLEGESKPSKLHYDWSYFTEQEQVKHEREIGRQVIHWYTITNNGPSKINEAEMLIFWPYATASGQDLMYLLEPPHVLGNIRCERSDFNYLGYQIAPRKDIWKILDVPVINELSSKGVTSKKVHSKEMSSKEASSKQESSVTSKMKSGGVVVEINKATSGIAAETAGKQDDKKFDTGDGSDIHREREMQRSHQTHQVDSSGKSILVTKTTGEGSTGTHTQTITKTFRNITGPEGRIVTYIQNTTIVRGPDGKIIHNETKTYETTDDISRGYGDLSISGQHSGSHIISNQGQGQISERRTYQHPYSSVEWDVTQPNEQNQNIHEHQSGQSRSSQSQTNVHQSEYHHGRQYQDGQDIGDQYQNRQYQTNQHQRNNARSGQDHIFYSSSYNGSSDSNYAQPVLGVTTLDHGAKVGVFDMGVPDRNVDQTLSRQSGSTHFNEHPAQQAQHNLNLNRDDYDTSHHRSGHRLRTHSGETQGQYNSGENRNYQQSGNRQESHSESRWSQSVTPNYDFRIDNAETSRHERNKRQLNEDVDLTKEVQCKATKCKYIKCFVGPMLVNENAVIALRTRINATTLKNISSTQNITFSTMMVGKITSVPYIGIPSEEEMVDYEIVTNVEAPEPEPQPDVVPLWIVVLSAVAGALILLLLIFLFYKCGFFKRHRPSNAPERQPLNRNGHYSSGDEAL